MTHCIQCEQELVEAVEYSEGYYLCPPCATEEGWSG